MCVGPTLPPAPSAISNICKTGALREKRLLKNHHHCSDSQGQGLLSLSGTVREQERPTTHPPKPLLRYMEQSVSGVETGASTPWTCGTMLGFKRCVMDGTKVTSSVLFSISNEQTCSRNASNGDASRHFLYLFFQAEGFLFLSSDDAVLVQSMTCLQSIPFLL